MRPAHNRRNAGSNPARATKHLPGPRDFGHDATNVAGAGSTPARQAISLHADGLRRRPSEGWLRAFNSLRGGQFAGQHKIACGVLGKDDGKAQVLRLAPTTALQALTVMQSPCKRQNGVQVAGSAPTCPVSIDGDARGSYLREGRSSRP